MQRVQGGTILHEGIFNDGIYSLRVEVVIAHQGATDGHSDRDGDHDKAVDYPLHCIVETGVHKGRLMQPNF